MIEKLKIKLGTKGKAWLIIADCKGEYWKEATFQLHNWGLKKGKHLIIEVMK